MTCLYQPTRPRGPLSGIHWIGREMSHAKLVIENIRNMCRRETELKVRRYLLTVNLHRLCQGCRELYSTIWSPSRSLSHNIVKPGTLLFLRKCLRSIQWRFWPTTFNIVICKSYSTFNCSSPAIPAYFRRTSFKPINC